VKTYLFRVVIEPDDGKWRAYCPALEEKGAATWGNTFEEALKNIQEFELRTQKGSHQHYRHPDGRRVTISFRHLSDTFPLLQGE